MWSQGWKGRYQGREDSECGGGGVEEGRKRWEGGIRENRGKGGRKGKTQIER